MKRALAILILFSMTLHCASRLGILSHLYKERHSIAYSLGFTAERVIAMCNNDYDFGAGLIIQHHETEKNLPAGIFQARDITLYFEIIEHALVPVYPILAKKVFPPQSEAKYPPPLRKIFHPPLV